MKTSLIARTTGAAAVLATFALATVAQAGPGSQFWRAAEKTSNAPAAAASEAKHLCPGAAVVPVTAMKPSWSNGRGPLEEVQIGTKTVCRMCPVTQVVTTNAWSNGRGSVTRTEVIVPGALHDCSKSCAAIAMK